VREPQGLQVVHGKIPKSRQERAPADAPTTVRQAASARARASESFGFGIPLASVGPLRR
jgi:hypothetical protein